MPVLRTTPPRLPTRLGKAPLVDAIFETRFQPKKQEAAQLLPGLFFARLGNDYPRSEALPVASIPPEFRKQNPTLQYQFHYRLLGDSGAISVGDRCAGVSALPPYQGWESFRPRIDAFVSVLNESALVKKLERFSLKFVNVLDMPAEPQLGLLNLNVQLGGVTAPDQGFRLRTELNDANLVRIVDVTSNMTLKLLSGESRSGLLLSIDCIKQVRSGSLSEMTPEAIEDMHQQLKLVFFGLITSATLAALDPRD